MIPTYNNSLIASQTLGADADVEFANIPATYTHLRVICQSVNDTGAAAIDVLVNNLTTASYDGEFSNAWSTSHSATENVGGNSVRCGSHGRAATYIPNLLEMMWGTYTDTGYENNAVFNCQRRDGNSTGQQYNEWGNLSQRGLSALSTLDILANGATLHEAGSQFYLYGIR
jgi:hypothetical protein